MGSDFASCEPDYIMGRARPWTGHGFGQLVPVRSLPSRGPPSFPAEVFVPAVPFVPAFPLPPIDLFMSRPRLTAILAVLLGFCLARPGYAESRFGPTFATPKEAAQHPQFAVQGEYVGEQLAVQVVALGKGDYQIVIYRGGLPGDGWNGETPQVLEGGEDEVLDFTDGLEKVNRTSPTSGAKPPPGAVILFDGSKKSLEENWQQGATMTDEGLLTQGATTAETYQDFSAHVEFRVPFQPEDQGQKRGNSGAYWQGRYETQVLDSFGLDPQSNDCGGIYRIAKPPVNVCFPPLSWQTYDVDFTAARFDDSGKKLKNARITVRLNGVLIHNDVELPHSTTASPLKEGPEPGPLHLQDHGNPVRFRNIWLVPKDADREARRPIVPGFERFYASVGNDPAAGGRLLIGELGCTNCHETGDNFGSQLTPKQAPLLDDLAGRVRPDWLRAFLNDPHATKPGSTMPVVHLESGRSSREQQVDDLVQFLIGSEPPTAPEIRTELVGRGDELYHSIGCSVCHGPHHGKAVSTATTVPLGPINQKYSTEGLTNFLKDPHAVRPSGRMPSFRLGQRDAESLAHYLLFQQSGAEIRPNLQYTLFEGEFSRFVDAARSEPIAKGECVGFDLDIAGDRPAFAIEFSGRIVIPASRKYAFKLTSNDGSRLWIDGKLVVDNGGLHSEETVEDTATLSAGVHRIRVGYFQNGGGRSLDLSVTAQGQSERPATVMLADLAATESMLLRAAAEKGKSRRHDAFDPRAAIRGEQLFLKAGCADCHVRHQQGRRLESVAARTLPSLDDPELHLDSGCLAAEPTSAVPDYSLTRTQRTAIVAALQEAGRGKNSPGDEAFAGANGSPGDRSDEAAREKIRHTMVTFNCYACHQRDGRGGPERDRNHLFVGVIPEMGDEGRLPPPLDGVGDKLRDDWLRQVLHRGAEDRPYMQVKMPEYASEAVDALAPCFVQLDRRSEVDFPALPGPEHRIKEAGRQLVGAKSLACIKCHTFAQYPATGIQAIGLDTMHRRLRRDWFHRYVANPTQYRPGTRMPSGFTDGRSVVEDVYDGDPGRQLSAIWHYLADGNKAVVPDGLIADPIELVAESRPVIYRNFLEGVSPRGIAVGYPEQMNLVFDADRLALRSLWHGRFIDASKHWQGRGQGSQRPMGIPLPLEETLSLAVGAEAESLHWPSGDAKSRGYRFRGYRLDGAGRPVFRYSAPGIEVQDRPAPETLADGAVVMRRQLTVTRLGDEQLPILFRAAAGDTLVRVSEHEFQVDGALNVRVEPGRATDVTPESLRQQQAVYQLPAGKTVGISQVISW